MRVALYLLLLLALAAIPGSVFPQRSTSPAKVSQYFTDYPEIAPRLDRFGMFDVYGSVWFSSIYILLMVSLIGCVVPRTRQYFRDRKRSLPQPPQDAWDSDGLPLPSVATESLARQLSGLRWTGGESWVTVELGSRREVFNIGFHASLLGVLVCVAVGALFGYHGQVIVREGTGFTNVIAQYDSFGSGRFFTPSALGDFTVTLNDLKVTYSNSGRSAGSATDYAATVKVRDASGEQSTVIAVNAPLDVAGTSVFLIGHGYAPEFEVRDRAGDLMFADSVVFLPQDANFTSKGVVKVPDMRPQVGLDAIFAPTAVVTKARGPHSLYPDLIDPKVFMSAWTGDLGLDNGTAQNVYLLDTKKMTRIGHEELSPGESWALPGDVGTVKFTGVVEFATFNINSDPGSSFALFFALMAVLCLTLMLRIRRRQLWVLRDLHGNWRVVAFGETADNDAANLARRLLPRNAENSTEISA